jgi:hypothetical protein
MTRILRFKDQIFIDGLNMTIRRGKKWATEKYAIIENRGIIEISTRVKKFCDIQFSEMLKWHLRDEKKIMELTFTKAVEQMYLEMISIYPDFTKTEKVTLVYFYI